MKAIADLKFNQSFWRNVALLFVLTAMFLSTPLKAFDNPTKGDTLYVWARTGLNLRTSPDINSDRIAILLPGSQVEVIGFTQEKYTITALPATEDEMHPFVLTGHWIYVKFGYMEGYVLDTYLLPIPSPEEGQSMSEYLVANGQQFEDLGGEDQDFYSLSCHSVNDIFLTIVEGEIETESVMELPNFSIEDGYIFYHFFYNLGKHHTQTTTNYLFRNWKEELSIFRNDSIELNFRMVEGRLYVTEYTYEEDTCMSY